MKVTGVCLLAFASVSARIHDPSAPASAPAPAAAPAPAPAPAVPPATVAVPAPEETFCILVSTKASAGTCFDRCGQKGSNCGPGAAPAAPAFSTATPSFTGLASGLNGFTSSSISQFSSAFPTNFSPNLFNTPIASQATLGGIYRPAVTAATAPMYTGIAATPMYGFNGPALTALRRQANPLYAPPMPSFPYYPPAPAWSSPSLPYVPPVPSVQIPGDSRFQTPSFPYSFQFPFGALPPAPNPTAPAAAPAPIINGALYGSTTSPVFASTVATGALNTMPLFSPSVNTPAVSQFFGPTPFVPATTAPVASTAFFNFASAPAVTSTAAFAPINQATGCQEATSCSCDSGCEIRGDCCFDYCAFCKRSAGQVTRDPSNIPFNPMASSVPIASANAFNFASPASTLWG